MTLGLVFAITLNGAWLAEEDDSGTPKTTEAGPQPSKEVRNGFQVDVTTKRFAQIEPSPRWQNAHAPPFLSKPTGPQLPVMGITSGSVDAATGLTKTPAS